MAEFLKFQPSTIPNDFDNALDSVEYIPFPYYRFALLRKVWQSPVFQRRHLEQQRKTQNLLKAFKLKELPKPPSPYERKRNLVLGIPALILLIGILALLVYALLGPNILLRNYVMNIFELIAWLVFIFAISYQLLTKTSLRIKSLVKVDHQDPVLASPIGDNEIYSSEVQAGIFLHLGNTGFVFIAFWCGMYLTVLFLVIIAVIIAVIIGLDPIIAFEAFMGFTALILFLSMFGLVEWMTIIVSAMYATIVPVIGAAVLTLIHNLALLIGTFYIGYSLISSIWPDVKPWFGLMDYPHAFFAYMVFVTVLLTLFTILSHKIGLWLFSRARRGVLFVI